MIKDNKVGQYILYAIGEIFLVVVGILIAVNIDDWNENNKRKSVESELISALNIEFKENLEYLKVAQTSNDSTISSMSTVLQLMSQSIENVFSPAQMDSIFLRAMNDIRWNISEYTLKRVNLLRQDENAQLLSLIYDWSRNLDRLKQREALKSTCQN